ncbi:MAG: sugar transferase [Pseudomonadota bacterium]
MLAPDLEPVSDKTDWEHVVSRFRSRVVPRSLETGLIELTFCLIILPTILSYVVFDRWVLDLWSRHFAFVYTLAFFALVASVYARSTSAPGRSVTLHVLGRVGLVMMVFFVIIVIGRIYYSRSAVILAFALTCVFSIYLIRYLRRRFPEKIGVVPIGHGEALCERFRFNGNLIESEKTSPRSFDAIAADFSVDIPVVWSRYLADAMLAGKPVLHVAQLVESRTGTVSIDHFGENHLKTIQTIGTYSLLKRASDLGLLLVLGPIVLIMVTFGALGILLTMGRPILFVQQRIGRNGVPFPILKLRTMLTGKPPPAPEEGATSARDPRITRVGAFLRRFRIDELPQFWNVLRGDMSVVGPRPEEPHRAMRYAETIPNYGYRHLVRPGITGWAQIRYGYAQTDKEARDKLAHDLYYVKHLSLLLDLRIILNTMIAVVRGTRVR